MHSLAPLCTHATLAQVTDPEDPQRVIHHCDGVEWLREVSLAPSDVIVTSLPDFSGLPKLGFEGWRTWFIDACEQVCRAVHEDSLAIFYQTDIKHEGRWVDKSVMVSEGARRAGSHLLWRKVVCRVAPGITTFGRPAYAHLLCFSREARHYPSEATPDVLPQTGETTWSRGMGADVCGAIVKFLKERTECTKVVDPFCGQGSILAAANAQGLDAVGVEISKKRVAKARRLGAPSREP